MKRFFFSLIALAAVAASCTQSALVETPDLVNAEVSFTPYTGRTPVTKAASVDLTHLQKPSDQGGGFRVYGFLNQVGKNQTVYMDNELVTYDSSKNPAVWTYDNMVYWPDASSKSTLSFVAYNAVDNGLTANSSGLTFTVPREMSNQVDLLATAYQENLKIADTQNGSGNVSLQFHHLLSRVGFSVQTTTSTKITINSLTLTGKMYETATLDFDAAKNDETPVLVESGDKTTVSYVYTSSPIEVTGATSAKAIKANDYMMILPHIVRQGDDHIIEVSYKIGDNVSVKTAKVELQPDFEFKAGKAYEFILKISTSTIKFEVTEQTWGDGDVEEEYPINPMPKEAVVLGGAAVNAHNSATVNITVNKENLAEIGVAFRVSGVTTWTRVASDSNSVGNYSIALTGLNSNTVYEYAAYSKETASSDYIYYPASDYPTFTTKANVILNAINQDTHITSSTVTLTGVCSDNISEYGFCWVKGDETPSELDNVVNKTTNNITISNGEFSYTIEGLDPNTQYTCCAYVETASGLVTYSAARTFTTKFAVQEEDNTGGNWGTGDTPNFD